MLVNLCFSLKISRVEIRNLPSEREPHVEIMTFTTDRAWSVASSWSFRLVTICWSNLLWSSSQSSMVFWAESLTIVKVHTNWLFGNSFQYFCVEFDYLCLDVFEDFPFSHFFLLWKNMYLFLCFGNLMDPPYFSKENCWRSLNYVFIAIIVGRLTNKCSLGAHWDSSSVICKWHHNTHIPDDAPSMTFPLRIWLFSPAAMWSSNSRTFCMTADNHMPPHQGKDQRPFGYHLI